MGKLSLSDPASSDKRLEKLLAGFESRIRSCPPGTCPLIVLQTLLQTAIGQTCGKCVPCRDGLPRLAALLQKVLDGAGTRETLDELRALAATIRDASDCAIGYQAAADFLLGMDAFAAEYEAHIQTGQCSHEVGQRVPCIALCPAHVDIPGYIALVRSGDCAGAVNLIRKDNPFPTACAMICEHPCEARCRRRLIDDAINIRGLKRCAVDHAAADQVAVPLPGPSTGKKIAVVGGGPAGLTAAYFLAQMGHRVVVYERQEMLGGMLRYGIPNYRFPKDRLDEDIRAILSAGDIEVKCGAAVGTDVTVEALRREYDALFIAIGAQAGKSLRMENIDAGNVYSAVDFLDRIGHGQIPDYSGKTVVVVGGGNVAMDAARSAVRCKAKDVRIVYRRRRDDMTALPEEVESAVEEGIDLITLQAPKSIEKGEDGCCTALWVQPQRIGPYDRAGRPAPMDAAKEPVRIAADVILIAVGQDIVSAPFAQAGLPTGRGGVLEAGLDTAVPGMPGVFAGGDCATSPATVIRAVAAGKVAARNIDDYLGYCHKLSCQARAPAPKENNRVPTGRANLAERPAYERKRDFAHTEMPFSQEEAMQEADRCLRCDHFGCGVLKGGRDE